MVCKLERDFMKISKGPLFTKCKECECLRSSLLVAARQGRDTTGLLSQRDAAVIYLVKDQCTYHLKMEVAKFEPTSYMSIVVNGMHQTKFLFRHFTTYTNDELGNRIYVHLVGVLIHAAVIQLLPSTMTDDHATGSNLVIEAINRVINSKAMLRNLPRTFSLQVDSCSRETKNKYLMSYMQALLRLRGFVWKERNWSFCRSNTPTLILTKHSAQRPYVFILMVPLLWPNFIVSYLLATMIAYLWRLWETVQIGQGCVTGRGYRAG